MGDKMKLDTKDMTYGSIIVICILSLTGVLIFEDSEGSTYYLSQDGAIANWTCEDPMMKSDCINGVKAEGVRCYYNPDNGYKYKNCKGLWSEIEFEHIKEPIIYIDADKYICNKWGCVKK